MLAMLVTSLLPDWSLDLGQAGRDPASVYHVRAGQLTVVVFLSPPKCELEAGVAAPDGEAPVGVAPPLGYMGSKGRGDG